MKRLAALLLLTFLSRLVMSDITPLEKSSDFAMDPILSRALKMASDGKLQDKALISELKIRFQKAKDLRTKVFVANLLSHASVFAIDPMPYINYVLAEPSSSQVLGSAAVLRLHRYRADDAYDNGKFARALPDYQALTQTSEPLVRQYAVLKLGWCLMNLDKPEEAWRLWITEVRDQLKTADAPSPNFLHSLGQAFTEKRNWSAEDGEMLASLKLDESQRQSVMAGFEQGLDVVKSYESMQTLSQRTEKLSWSKELSSFLLQKTTASGKRACEFLPWLHIPPRGPVILTQPEAPKVLESCIHWNAKAPVKDTLRQKVDSDLAEFLPRLQLKGPERRLRILFAQYRKDSATVCRDALTWLTEPIGEFNTEAARLGIPVKEVATHCVNLAQTGETARSEIAGFYRNAAASGKWLRSEKDPLTFVLLATVQEASFGDFFSSRVTTDAPTYQPTLVPALLVERMNAKKNYAAADLLFDAFSGKQTDNVHASPAWGEILSRRLSTLLAANQLAEARVLLEQRLPSPQDPSFSAYGVRLWSQYLARARTAQLERSRAIQIADQVLTAPRVLADRKNLPGMVEILGSLENWNRVHEIASSDKKLKVSALASDRLKVDMVAAVTAGQISSAQWSDIDDAGLKFIFEVGDSLKNGASLQTLKIVGKSPVSADLKVIQDLQNTQTKLLDQKALNRDPAHKALAWIQHLDRNRKRIRSRPWSHVLFAEAAERSLKDFCRDAQGSLPALQQALIMKDQSKEKWAPFFSSFGERLEECQAQSVEVAE